MNDSEHRYIYLPVSGRRGECHRASEYVVERTTERNNEPIRLDETCPHIHITPCWCICISCCPLHCHIRMLILQQLVVAFRATG